MVEHHLVDDGTLDTVVKCSDCGEQTRFDSAALIDSMPAIMRDHDQVNYFRVVVALEQANQEHECVD